MSITLVDVKNHLFTHFLTESVFSLSDDLANIKLTKGELGETLAKLKDEPKAALFRAALESFKSVNIVAELGAPGSGVYILTQPLNTFTQTVPITPVTAEMIADLINGPGRILTGNKKYTASKLSLTDSDLQTVVAMCHGLLDESMGEMDDDDMDDEDGPPEGFSPGSN